MISAVSPPYYYRAPANSTGTPAEAGDKRAFESVAKSAPPPEGLEGASLVGYYISIGDFAAAWRLGVEESLELDRRTLAMAKEAAELSSRSLDDWQTMRADTVERLGSAKGAERAELSALLRAIDLSSVSSREADKVQQKSYADALARLQPMIDQWTASLAALDKKGA